MTREEILREVKPINFKTWEVKVVLSDRKTVTRRKPFLLESGYQYTGLYWVECPVKKRLCAAFHHEDETFYPGRDLSPNNGYNCRHPGCEIVEDGIGCCYAFSCPLAYEADEEDCARFGVEYEEGEFMVVKIPEEKFNENHMWRENGHDNAKLQ